MSDIIRRHYELYPYPQYPLLASVRRCDTYAINLAAIWSRFNGRLPGREAQRILIAGCGSFAPYPFALSNPKSDITALDLSLKSLKRARLHCMLHGRRNITFRCGDLLDPKATEGKFDLIDSFGVLHHLDDPLAGLKALGALLNDKGILRIMVYSRYARREEESIRRAFRLLGVHDPATAKHLIKRSKHGSRLRSFMDTSAETAFDAGLADALLHPRVHTFLIDGFMKLISQSGMEPLLFVHNGALENVGSEVERIRRLETTKQSPGNFILYLGRNVSGSSHDDASYLVINPCISNAVGPLNFGTQDIPPRLGRPNQPLDRNRKRFLRQFLRPISWSSLSPDVQTIASDYIKSLFLLRYRQ